MSFVLTVWSQPAGLPLPRDVDEAAAQLAQVMKQPPGPAQPVLAAFVAALHARFPDSPDGVYDAGSDGLMAAPCEAHCNIGLSTHADAFDAAYAHAVVQANDRGLHVMDEQNGFVFLANGRALALGEPQHGLRAYDALQRGDHAAAWAEYRRLAPLRDPTSLRDWGFLICNGTACPRHVALGAAMAQLSGLDPASDAELARCLGQVRASLRPQQEQLLAGLKAATDPVAFVDAALAQHAARQAVERAARTAAAAGAAPPRPPAAATPADPATWEAAKTLGIAPDWVTSAATGQAAAQRRLGQALLWNAGKGSPALAQLATRWLERAVAQGDTTAQALLGGALLNGWRHMPIDMKRGLALLEQSAAADHPLALNDLADHLQGKSTRKSRQTGRTELLTDEDSVRNRARVLDLCTRWAALGNAKGLFGLACRLHDGIGAAADKVAAKGVAQLLKHPPPWLRAEHAKRVHDDHPEVMALFEPTRDDSREVFALARELAADIQRLPEILARRRAARAALLPAPEAAPTAEPATQPRGSTLHSPRRSQRRDDEDEDEDDNAPPPASGAWHAGHAALLAGALGFLLMMVMLTSLGKTSFRAAALAVGLSSAYGVWRVGDDLGWGTGRRALLALVALVPMAGFVVCAVVGAQRLKRR